MFNEDEDWNDEADAQILSKTVLQNTQKANSSTNVKPKVVGKKSLLRTLQTLGSVPEWKSADHQQDSDSETETAPSPSKKKRRKKKRKHAATSGGQEENGDLDQSIKEEKTVTKKKKKDNKLGAPKAKNTSVDETNGKEIPNSASKPEDMQNLNRQQWKNKMKNKRKCKNKYRQNNPDEEVNKAESAEKHRPKEEVTTDSYSNNKNSEKTQMQTKTQKEKTGKACKPQKRKNTEEETDICGTSQAQTLGEEKQLTEKEKKTKSSSNGEGTSDSVINITKQKAEIRNEQQDQTPPKKLKPELSKEESAKREQLRKLLNRQETHRRESPVEQKEEPTLPEEEVKQDRSASLRSRMEQRLESARFRYINEVLYSTSSGDAKCMFRQDPQAFSIYHRGYTAQVERWPANPVDAIISYIKQKPASHVVADFGCGDCKIARSVKNKVHSFDLAAACDLVTVCDMANVPLKDKSVDIIVFCLSLMGTNLADFLAEANRVLKMGGVLKIAEVASRFDNVRSFVTALANLGFKMVSKDTENSHFYSFDCVKTSDAPENIKKFGLQLNPCLYKKR
ncbi:ribosomal RNA-processing protein 8 [Scomber scombrus]|uniref:ribosomal RNA-processing protein 8 n=1 Tax=Scomber scombrus TaxID=13677 RepID=UPI002DDBA4F0|nr:ribosomal RNA-processing protein 8 [Scomber scombrus]